MNRDIILKKIKKIKVLLDSFEDNASLSSLERDLLLSYIRNLYDAALDGTSMTLNTVKPAQDINQEVSTSNKFIASNQEIQKTEEVLQRATTKEDAKTENHIIDQKPNEEIILAPQLIVPHDTKPAPQAPNKVSDISVDVLNEIFKEGTMNELSDKLGMSHINDIRMGMGLNERLFTQKELFGDNSAHFNEVLDALNKANTFEEAKVYLIEKVIPIYKWDSETNLKKAATFVKLVRRKFY